MKVLKKPVSNGVALGLLSLKAALFLFLGGLISCQTGTNAATEFEKKNLTFITTTGLTLDGITTPVTLRVTITQDGSTTAVVDEFHHYAENWINTEGSAPITFSQDYTLEYDQHTFDFAVYYCDCGEITDESMLSSAVLLGSVSVIADINNFSENILAEIQIGSGNTVEDSLSSFPATPTFTAESVYAPGSGADAGQHSSLALDSDGNPHIAFLYAPTSTTKRLSYTFDTTGTWETPWVLEEDNGGSTAYENVGEYASLAIDSQDTAHIAYYDNTRADARYISVMPDDTMFNTSERIAASATIGKYASLALYETRDGIYPYVAFFYSPGNNASGYAQFSNLYSGTWNGFLHSTAFSASGKGKFTSLVFDQNDSYHVVFYHGDSSKQLIYMTCPYDADDAGDCTSNTSIITMDDTLEQNISLAIDFDNTVHILVYDYTNGDLKHVYGTDATGFTTETIADGIALAGMGQYSSLAIDHYNRLHIAYYDADTQSLQYLQGYTGDAWTSLTPITIDGGAGSDVGKFVSLKLDEGLGLIHLSYYDATNQQLKYALGE